MITATRSRTDPPPAWRVGLARGVIEIKQFFRERSGAAFTFAFPAAILVVFGATSTGDVVPGVTVREYFVPGMIALGMVFTSFTNLAVAIAVERDQGTLKRLALTPMPRTAYFVGKIALVLLTTVVQIVLLLAIGTVFFGISLPGDLGAWLTLGWLLPLGVAALTLMGIAVSSLPPSGRSAGAIVNIPVLLLMFVSGVFSLPFTGLPQWAQQIGAVFPVKWLVQGLRSVFLPEAAAGLEPAGAWEHDRIALILAVWCIAGLLLCVTTFRWKTRSDG